MISECIILAGGFGTRLQKVVSDLPKPMAPVNGKPFLEYIFQYLNQYHISHVVLSVGYKSEFIANHFQKRFLETNIDYAYEEKPLGTGGGILNAMKNCSSEKILVLNGDSFFDVNIFDLEKFHSDKKADITVCLRQLQDTSRYGTVEINGEKRVVAFNEKKFSATPGLINGGTYLMNKSVFKSINFPSAFSIEKNFFEKYVSGKKICGYISEGYFIDIGVPEDYAQAQTDLPFKVKG